jgi:membrane dipeptidase
MNKADEQSARHISVGVKDLLQASIVWDNHVCLPLRMDESFLSRLERYKHAGVNVISINVGFADTPWVDHVRVISLMRQWIARRPDAYSLISKVSDVLHCKSEGKLGVVFDIEGMFPVQDELNMIQTFYELGVRWMLIAYNRRNAAGSGCLDVDTGLTAVGRRVIDEMERVGMVLCLSHTGARTAFDALEYARNPAIFSHSNPYGDTPHARNISDELLLACARKGGVIGLSGIGAFLGGKNDLVKKLLRQIRYVVDRVGPDHVGLGLDYVFDTKDLAAYVRTNPASFPPGLMTGGVIEMIAPEEIGSIVDELARTNLSDSQIRGILGGNWLRVATQVWS